MDVSEIISDLDDHGFSDTSPTRKMAVINEAYWDVCGREPWPFLEKSATLSFTGSDTPSNLPADFNAVVQMVPAAGATYPVNWMRYDDWLNMYGNTPSTGIPQVFYFIGSTMHFYPTPTNGTQVTMFYLSTPVELQSTDAEAAIVLPPQFHRTLLVNGALYRLYAMEDDMALSQGFQTFYETGIARMIEWAFKKQYQRPDVIRPVDPDDINLEGDPGYGVV